MSGTKRNRPELIKAIDYSKENGCTLVIAKLDRLARDCEFVFKIVNTGISIYFCDLPVVNTMILGVLASMAQYERELCSKRTKDALKVRMEQGVMPGRANGNYKVDDIRQSEGRKSAARTRVASTVSSPEFGSFCRIIGRVFPELPKDISEWDNEPKAITRYGLSEMAFQMRNARADNGELFKGYELDGSERQMRTIRSRIANTFKTIGRCRRMGIAINQ